MGIIKTKKLDTYAVNIRRLKNGVPLEQKPLKFKFLIMKR